MGRKIDRFLHITTRLQKLIDTLKVAGIHEHKIWLPVFDGENVDCNHLLQMEKFLHELEDYCTLLMGWYKHQTPEAWEQFKLLCGDFPEVIELNRRRRVVRVYFNKNLPELMKRSNFRGTNRRDTDGKQTDAKVDAGLSQ